MKKSARTISGVAPVAVMVEPRACPGRCVYCPTQEGAPQSYTIESPAVLRARRHNFRPADEIIERLKTLTTLGHPVDKVELIVMGGTFLAYPVEYQYRFIKDCYDALNGQPSADLDEAKRINETAEYRCVGLCIETRPDWCRDEHIKSMLEFGTTRVELGVQTLDDGVYRLVQRGHTVSDVVDATRRLKQAGLKVYYHWMPGLPGNTPERDLELSRMLFNDPRFRPDGLKLYPTLVVKGSQLETWHREGRFQPYDNALMASLLIDIKTMVPPWVRIARVMRDIPTRFIIAGCRDSALRGTIKKRMLDLGVQCRCIRCREYGHRLSGGWKPGTPRLVRRDYDASGGDEVFLSFEDEQETLFGLLRLRIEPSLPPAKRAVVREIHVFGPEVPLGARDARAAQHRGWGQQLLKEAERIACEEFQAANLAVLAGVGAREYFRHYGYRLEGAYMVKELKCP